MGETTESPVWTEFSSTCLDDVVRGGGRESQENYVQLENEVMLFLSTPGFHGLTRLSYLLRAQGTWRGAGRLEPRS